jgi:hypothetical protein
MHIYIEQRRQFSSGGSFRPLFIIAGFLNILSKVSGKCYERMTVEKWGYLF